jgi:UDP-N-acetylmuramate dehydrogenase
MNPISHNIPLADKNWFKTGGNAKFYAEPTTAQEFADALLYAKENFLEIFVLGEGANILISDDGFDGLVIRPQLNAIAFDLKNNTVTAGAGVSVPNLINVCLDHKLSGLEEFSGIPGTVGGSVYINIHYYQFLLSDFLCGAQVIEKSTGAILNVTPEWFAFGYNFSTLHESNYYLVSATFQLQPLTDLETAYARGRQTEIIRHRNKRYPLERTCGSFFRNFFKEEYMLAQNAAQVPYVAYYLDKVGVKGVLRSGGAVVSYLHANMIVTEPGATTTDVINLVKEMQSLVQKNFGILPQNECQLIGFKKFPLLKN